MKEIRISVPEGVSEFSVQVNKDGIATVLYDTPVKEWEPEDGEIVSGFSSGNIVIYAGTTDFGAIISYAGCNRKGGLTMEKCIGWGYTSEYRPASEEEKKRIFDELARVSLRWNAKKKKLENISRWRAKNGDTYFCVLSDLTIKQNRECDDLSDDALYRECNYFKTNKAAEKAAKEIREIFKNSKSE